MSTPSSPSNNEYDKSHEINTWDDLGLSIPLLRSIYSYGFENPSPIQKKAIYPMIKGNDIIVTQSGTGKTGAFSISTLQLINTKSNTTQAMILSPTRGYLGRPLK